MSIGDTVAENEKNSGPMTGTQLSVASTISGILLIGIAVVSAPIPPLAAAAGIVGVLLLGGGGAVLAKKAKNKCNDVEEGKPNTNSSSATVLNATRRPSAAGQGSDSNIVPLDVEEAEVKIERKEINENQSLLFNNQNRNDSNEDKKPQPKKRWWW
jgi:hypothetical protein